ncbi:MAG: phosphate ABC transporter permease PstA [Chloroflexota bacterium]
MSHTPLSPAARPGFNANLPQRHRLGKIWQGVFTAATAFGMLMLAVLVLNIVNDAFGYAAISYTVQPSSLTPGGAPLQALAPAQLVEILKGRLRPARLKTIEKSGPLDARPAEELRELVMVELVKPKVEQTWELWPSLTGREAIQAEAAKEHPGSQLVFRSWLSQAFVQSSQSSNALLAGVHTAILGSLLVILITILVAFPIGIGAAIYLQEYAGDAWYNRLIQTNINNLAGVPSIIYGMLGLAIFVRLAGGLTSGAFSGYPGADPNAGRTILSAGLTMALLILPVIIINAQEAIKAVPNSLREASYGVAATRWQTVWSHVLPNAMSGILTGAILAVSRAFGETAPLIIVGASTYITFDPDGVFSRFTTLPIQIYQWTSRAQGEFRSLAAAGILVLMTLLLALNAAAVLLRNRFSGKSL